jgi:DNA mismatch repair protein MutL
LQKISRLSNWPETIARMDIIKLLPDSVANQIAAGEVIQRPASAVKELLENAIDSGATEIVLIVKDSGKTLIQVTDNGCGMSETDARLCFERHATSKIREANDLFAIRTMGFRGEALASIAAIGQVELKTKRIEDELGTSIHIEGSSVKSQEPCQCPNGTSFIVKNLFYNVPARRNFLKSDTTEMGYIIEEFQRVALVNPGTGFSLFHNGKNVFKLETGNLRQRIIAIFGANYSQKLVNIETDTNLIKVGGFIGKPEFAKKTRGEQYFFANGRFIKHPYFHHAVEKAYQELLPENTYPSYFIFLDVDPKTIDINIHPTKTEVKFEDEKSLYMIIRSAVKQSLGKFSLTPSLDFEIEKSMDFPELKPGETIKVPEVKINPYFNPFEKNGHKTGSSANVRKGLDQWEKLYEPLKTENTSGQIPETSTETKIFESAIDENLIEQESNRYYQLQGRYILTQLRSGLMIINQQNAHERILFERLMSSIEKESIAIQQQLFPQTVHFSPSDAELLLSLKQEIHNTGFDIEDFGNGAFVVNGTPMDLQEPDVQGLLERVIENYKKDIDKSQDNSQIRLAVSLARQMAIKPGKILSIEEMRSLVDQLFACSIPDATPAGKKTFTIIAYEELEKKFK